MARIYETNDRVIMVEDGEIRHGVITQVFEHVPVVIVKFDDGEVEKVSPQRLAIEPVEKKEEPTKEELKKQRLAQTITITRGEMNDKLAKLTVKLMTSKECPSEISASALILIPLVITALFNEDAVDKLFDESEGNA